MSDGKMQVARRSIRLHLIVGLAVVVVLAGGLGGWASTAQISGALIAPGSVVVDSNVKKVQHPTGGVVGELRARDGDLVKAGDVVVRLDDTVTKASLAIVVKTLDGLWARAARLQAEQQGVDSIVFPPMLLTRADDPDVKNIMASETKLFEVRTYGRTGQKAQLRERVTQLNEEIGGLTAQEKAKEVSSLHQQLVDQGRGLHEVLGWQTLSRAGIASGRRRRILSECRNVKCPEQQAQQTTESEPMAF